MGTTIPKGDDVSAFPQAKTAGTASSWAPWETFEPRQRRMFLAILFLVATSNYIDRNIIGILLEPIKAEFQVSDTMLGLLSGLSFALLYATLGIPVARWADRGDRKVVIAVSLSIWSAMTIVCGLAANFWQLVAARFGVGAGEAGAIPPAQSLLADYFNPTERAKAIGIFVMSASVAYVIALVGGGYITEKYGWRTTYILFGLVGFALVPLVHFGLKEPRRLARATHASVSQESARMAMRALFSKSSYRNITAAMTIYYMMASGALAFIVALMIRLHGLSVSQAGALFGVIFAAGAVLGSIAGGVVADRLASRDVSWLGRSSGIGMILAAPCYLAALWAPTIEVMTPLLFLGAIAIHAAVPPAFSAIQSVCGHGRRALAVALMMLFANLIGLGIGPIMTGVLSDAFAPHYGSGEGLRIALLILMTLLVPAGWLMLRASLAMSAEVES